ncbi:MAG: carboxypeptidase regulatory-like domain-containing protein, partial [Thermoplasmata archaeon]|nr:carboxypeptidase regulatory-like domain-containing protein [Thermoplasmata archaeon]
MKAFMSVGIILVLVAGGFAGFLGNVESELDGDDTAPAWGEGMDNAVHVSSKTRGEEPPREEGGDGEKEAPEGAMATFTDNYSDEGMDLNSNTLYDVLAIDVEVNVTVGGEFVLSGVLGWDNGERMDEIAHTNTATYLDIGVYNITLEFKGWKIQQYGVNDTFSLNNLFLSAQYNELDERWSEAYTTAHYNYTEFDLPPAEFTDNYSDEGVHQDGDGLYDFLAIDVEVNVSSPGEFSFQGNLCTSDENMSIMIGSAYLDNIHLEVGTHTLTLKFQGWYITKNGENTTYDLRSLDLRQDGDTLDYRGDAYTTGFYNFTDFQPLPISLVGAYDDYGRDTDNDTLYNYLIISVDVEVNMEGRYQLTVTLGPEGDGGNSTRGREEHSSFSSSVTEYLEEGTHTLEVEFEGVSFYTSGLDTHYVVSDVLIMEMEEWYIIDSADALYTTAFYDHTDFDPPPAEIVEVTSYALDTNGNQLYEYLVVNVTLEVEEQGDYRISGSLKVSSGGLFDLYFMVPDSQKSNASYLEPGTHILQLWFHGSNICDAEMNGTIITSLTLYMVVEEGGGNDEGPFGYDHPTWLWNGIAFSEMAFSDGVYYTRSEEVDSTTHTAGIYDYDEFEPEQGASSDLGLLSGYVYDASTGEALTGVEIVAYGHGKDLYGGGSSGDETATDATGYYELNVPKTDVVELYASADGYYRYENELVLDEESMVHDLTLDPMGDTSIISGCVYGNDTKEPIGGADVSFSLSDTSGHEFYDYTCGNYSGGYEMELPPGSYWLSVHAYDKGYESFHIQFMVEGGTDLELDDIYLEPSSEGWRKEEQGGCMVSGQVSDAQGPLANALVFAAPQDSFEWGMGEPADTDATGHFEIELPSGDFKLCAICPYHEGGWAELTLEENASVSLAFLLSALPDETTRIYGVVEDSTGEPIAETSVMVLDMDTWCANHTYTDEYGSYEMNAHPGSFHIFVMDGMEERG